MGIGPITPGSPVTVTADSPPPAIASTASAPTATMIVRGWQIQALTLLLLNNDAKLLDDIASFWNGDPLPTGGVYAVQTVASLAALAAIGSGMGHVAVVAADSGGKGTVYGFYRLDTSSTATPDGFFVVACTSGAGGNWIRIANGSEPAERLVYLSVGLNVCTVSAAPPGSIKSADCFMATGKASAYLVTLNNPTIRNAAITYEVEIMWGDYDGASAGTIIIHRADGVTTILTLYANKGTGPQACRLRWSESAAAWVIASTATLP